MDLRVGLETSWDLEVIDVTAALEVLPSGRWPPPPGTPVIAHLDGIRDRISRASTTSSRGRASARGDPGAVPGLLRRSAPRNDADQRTSPEGNAGADSTFLLSVTPFDLDPGRSAPAHRFN